MNKLVHGLNARKYISWRSNLMNKLIDHEKLEVCRASLAFIAWLDPRIQKLPKTDAVRDQLERRRLRIKMPD